MAMIDDPFLSDGIGNLKLGRLVGGEYTEPPALRQAPRASTRVFLKRRPAGLITALASTRPPFLSGRPPLAEFSARVPQNPEAG